MRVCVCIHAVFMLYTEYCTLQVYIAGTNFSSNIFLKLAHAVYGYNLMTQQSNILAAYQSDKSLSITDVRDPPKKRGRPRGSKIK